MQQKATGRVTGAEIRRPCWVACSRRARGRPGPALLLAIVLGPALSCPAFSPSSDGLPVLLALPLCADVVNCMQTEDMELKKLVYLYLINYAKTQPDLAIMAVNTFVKACAGRALGAGQAELAGFGAEWGGSGKGDFKGNAGWLWVGGH